MFLIAIFVLGTHDWIIFLEGIAEDFTPDEPWHFVEPRSTIDEQSWAG